MGSGPAGRAHTAERGLQPAGSVLVTRERRDRLDDGTDQLVSYGEQLRDEAVERGGSAAPQDWMRLAHAVVIRLASTGMGFTTDDVWKALPECSLEKRAMGAVMLKAKREGVIVSNGQFQKSARPENHARDVRIWVGVL